ncbi:MAG: hypothetical protein QOC81_4255 [Thermoanaerobaculia bacterium]|jgi:hypothetical protein|nr:hypothetical protein [Thermoanaerobaculia bacterium]
MRKLLVVIVVIIIVVIGGLFIWNKILEKKGPDPSTVVDEAKAAGRDAASLKGADEDYYADMDYGVTKTPEVVRMTLDKYLPGITAGEAVKRAVVGRNNWVVWTAGNDRLWDVLSRNSAGYLDLLKTLSNHPSLKFNRSNRWSVLGLVNEPCFRKPSGPRADRWGLWLDERVEGAGCGPDPFENETKYPGVKSGARGTGKLALGSYYGYGTGIVGLRLFPNPYFDEAAQAKWDPVKYYTDPAYYNDASLIKPYRVGMSCGFCHVGPNPTNPPADPENPTWANLNSNPGAQYFWIDRIFMWDHDAKSFVFQLFHTSRPGALDTSLVSSDQINNPRTMNAIYNLDARLEIGRKWGAEHLAGGSADNKQFNDYVPPGTRLTKYFDKNSQTAFTTHVLKDGSDSVGALGALNRVYVNIGLFSENWLLHFKPLLGGTAIDPISPIRLADCDKNSSYWQANTAQTPDLALFFLASAKPDYLSAAPGGAAYLAADATLVPRGKEVFAERCARCHSSKLPEKAFTNFFPAGSIGPDYLKFWNDYWQWTKTQEFKDSMKVIVNDPNFLQDNYLSTEVRIPSTLMETNACSPLATNAIKDNIWDNFSSESYKNLPAVGKVMIHDPYTGEPSWYDMPGGGRGYTRPASLISLWSTAPYLQNNTLGVFKWSGSVADREAAFEDGITKLLWPEKREGSRSYVTVSGKSHPGVIDVTPEATYLSVAPGFLPPFLAPLSGPLDKLFPNVFHSGGIQLGPIPKGTPINLLSNIDLTKGAEVLDLLLHIKHDLHVLPAGYNEDEARKQFAPLVPKLLGVSKCKDFIVNKGHYFGTDFLPAKEGEPGLTDDDKHALIAFLKTF